MAHIVLGLLAILLLHYLWFYIRDMYRHRSDWGTGNWGINLLIGFLTNFMDTMGIGSFAPTTILLNITKQLPNDKLLPGTLNAADCVPVMLEAFIFIHVVQVEAFTLLTLVIAAILGAKVGARFVISLPEKRVQLYLGWALIVTAGFMAGKQLGLMNFLGEGNTAVGLEGVKLVICFLGNFIFGALMTVGCGLYAPCMAMVYLMGLSPRVAFPVMMASCAALMPVAANEFIVAGEYARKISLGILLGGIGGVYLATKFIGGLNVTTLCWMIITIVIYTGVSYVRKSRI